MRTRAAVGGASLFLLFAALMAIPASHAAFTDSTAASASVEAGELTNTHAPASGIANFVATSTLTGCDVTWSTLAGGLNVADRIELRDDAGTVLDPGTIGDIGPGNYSSASTSVVQTFELRTRSASTWISPVAESKTTTCINPSVQSVSTGDDSTCAIRSDQSLMCWGLGERGATADATGHTTAEPQVVAGSTWRQVSVGTDFACGIRPDATLWCWGEDWTGQLGTPGARNDTSSPTQVGADADWTSVEAFTFSACGVRSPGTLWCWGLGSSGQLGLGDTANRDTPTQVGTAQDWVTVVGQSNQACGVRADGTMWCWGANDDGKFGDGTFTSSTIPVQTVSPNTWTPSFANGTDHTCAIAVGGTLWCWGANWFGEQGLPTGAPTAVPQQVGAQSDWTQVVGGHFYTCALRVDQTIWCTGSHAKGKTGQGLTTGSTTTFTQVGTQSDWSHLDAGHEHVCAVNDAGQLHCWGWDGVGQLGLQTTAFASPTAPSAATDWAATESGYQHTCATRSDQSLWCFGDNGNGQLGSGHSTDGLVAPREVLAGTGFVSVALGDRHTCGVTSANELFCWGRNQGELGTGTIGGNERTPVQIGTATDWDIVAAGRDHSCAIRTDQRLWCWGSNAAGKLGDGTTTLRDAPVPIGTATWQAIDGGFRHTCGIQTNGTMWCWGANGKGQVGDGTNTDTTVPVQVGTATDWVHIGLGRDHSCGVRADGTGWCWGANDEGRVGDGTTIERVAPVALTEPGGWAEIDGGLNYTCGRKTTGEVWCWGSNTSAQFGDGAPSAGSVSPTLLHTNASDLSVSTGFWHTCDIVAGTLRCYGANDAGQLGLDAGVPTPTLVTGAHTWLE